MPELSLAELQAMPLEQLRALADAQAASPEPVVSPIGETAPPSEQPRGADGKFVSQNPPKEGVSVQDPAQADEPETVYQRIIDLGDGDGSQVFQGATLEELVDKLTEAQKHATRKIREQNRLLKETRQPAPQPVKVQLTADEKFTLAQRLMNEPDVVIEERLQEHLAKDPVYQDMRLQRKIAVSTRVFEQWQGTQPEFHFTPANGKKIGDMIALYHNGVATPENVESCYQALKADGLLQAKPADPAPPAPVPLVPVAQRRSSGLSARGSAAPPSLVSTEPTVEELYAMPLDKLEALARGHAAPRRW